MRKWLPWVAGSLLPFVQRAVWAGQCFLLLVQSVLCPAPDAGDTLALTQLPPGPVGVSISLPCVPNNSTSGCVLSVPRLPPHPHPHQYSLKLQGQDLTTPLSLPTGLGLLEGHDNIWSPLRPQCPTCGLPTLGIPMC